MSCHMSTSRPLAISTSMPYVGVMALTDTFLGATGTSPPCPRVLPYPESIHDVGALVVSGVGSFYAATGTSPPSRYLGERTKGEATLTRSLAILTTPIRTGVRYSFSRWFASVTTSGDFVPVVVSGAVQRPVQTRIVGRGLGGGRAGDWPARGRGIGGRGFGPRRRRFGPLDRGREVSPHEGRGIGQGGGLAERNGELIRGSGDIWPITWTGVWPRRRQFHSARPANRQYLRREPTTLNVREAIRNFRTPAATKVSPL